MVSVMVIKLNILRGAGDGTRYMVVGFTDLTL